MESNLSQRIEILKNDIRLFKTRSADSQETSKTEFESLISLLQTEIASIRTFVNLKDISDQLDSIRQ